ncbi:hypothetical protein [Pseudomonas bubulae]|uniref:hypothetical protein n=1 Tax=Pseudomonas bubulae TaxID=2316085 RepID=UPI001E4072FA|nr:hypothetical protein [Pseudomonas bubulae]
MPLMQATTRAGPWLVFDALSQPSQLLDTATEQPLALMQPVAADGRVIGPGQIRVKKSRCEVLSPAAAAASEFTLGSRLHL